MEKITVTSNKPSIKYSFLTSIAAIGNPILTKFEQKKTKDNTPIQNSYKTSFLKPWTNKIEQQYINGLQTFIINPSAEKCLVYFHGGAYISNPAPQHFTFLKEISTKTNCKIYFVIYPHLPNYSCEQAFNLLEEWFKQIPEQNLLLGGDSSGGGLAISLYKYITDKKIKTIEKVIALSPWLDVSLKNPNINNVIEKDTILDIDSLKNFGEQWKGTLNENDYLHSPINIKDWKDTPLLILSGTNEILAPDISDFCNNNKDANITWYEYDKLQHVFMLYPCKEAKNSREKIIDFILYDKKI